MEARNKETREKSIAGSPEVDKGGLDKGRSGQNLRK